MERDIHPFNGADSCGGCDNALPCSGMAAAAVDAHQAYFL